MLNKKGFTMVELMVSISLISLIMIFLVKILVDVRYEGTNEIYDVKDQISRAEIIKTIQNDIYKSKNELDGLEIDSVTKSGSNIKIKLAKRYYNSGTYTAVGLNDIIITVAADKLSYNNPDLHKSYSWPLEMAETNADVQYSLASAKCSVIWDSSSTASTIDYVVNIVIPVHMGKSTRSYRDSTTHKRKTEIMDSTLDNITLTFYGRNYGEVLDSICRGF